MYRLELCIQKHISVCYNTSLYRRVVWPNFWFFRSNVWKCLKNIQICTLPLAKSQPLFTFIHVNNLCLHLFEFNEPFINFFSGPMTSFFCIWWSQWPFGLHFKGLMTILFTLSLVHNLFFFTFWCQRTFCLHFVRSTTPMFIFYGISGPLVYL